jgi:hypothetical protein
MFNYVPIKHRQMSFLSNGGKFKLYTVLNALIFPTPTQLRISLGYGSRISCLNITFYTSGAFTVEKTLDTYIIPKQN